MRKLSLVLVVVSLVMANIISAQESPSTFTYKVGEAEVVLLSETQRDGTTDILIGASPEIIQQYAPDGTFPNAVNAYLIKMPGQNILVDAGFGTKLFDNLKSAGVSSEQIHVILLTHMHGDHIGGLLKGGEKTFPNARLYIPQPEYDYWMNNEIMNSLPEKSGSSFKNAQNVIASYQSGLELFQPNSLTGTMNSILPGITPLAAYGHTPGHTGYLLESQDQKLLIWGDLTHAMAVQMPHPEIAVTYDVDPVEATRSRQAILTYVVEAGIPIAGMHIAYPGMGDIKQSGSGYLFIAK